VGLFARLFGKQNSAVPGEAVVERQFGNYSGFGALGADIYDSDVVRSAIWTNAKNAGKLAPKHVRASGGKYDVFPIPRVRRVLERPNPYMGMSVFINKMVVQCLKKNNAFALIKFGQDGWPDGIYPISYSSAEALEAGGSYFVKFRLDAGKEMTVPYGELIHLRIHIDENDVFGAGNAGALSPVMSVVRETDAGIVTAIKKSAVIRYILKFNAVLNPDDKQREVDDFVRNYLTLENSGGAAATDPRYEAVQVKPESFVPNAAQMDRSKERIHSYFGVSDAIIQSRFTESEWNAYYENTIEPFAIQLSEEFTEKVFTQQERERGNMIIFEANRLQYASNGSKVNVGRFLTDIGAASLDQILEIFNMAPIGGEEGRRRVQTLNMVNAEKADQYQLGEGASEEGGNSDE
jgi:HK97 family phage portal protein